MGTKYSSNSASGYNSTPPADDGTVSEANKVKWDTIKTKLADPVKTLADTINSELATHFDNGPTALSTNTTLTASHYNQIIQASSAITLTLTAASTLGAGWFCWIRNNDPINTVTLSRATASDTFDLNTANYSIVPHEAVMVAVNAAANGFYTVTAGYKENQLYGKAPASVSAALAMDIYSVTSGMVDVVSAASASSITSFTTARSGVLRRLLFNQALTLTHNATSLVLPGSSNITTATGDSALMRSEGGGNWRCLNYVKSSGKPVKQNIVQVVEATPYATHTNTATQCPADDSIPQSTETVEIVTVSITPTSATNRLLIEGDLPVMSATSTGAVVTIFQDSGTDALAVASHYPSAADSPFTMRISYEMAAGTTSATTFRLKYARVGGSGNVYLNGTSGGRFFGGVSAVRFRVKEILV